MMKRKFIVLSLAFAFLLNAVGSTTFADVKTGKKTNTNNQLAALLPVSDGVLTVDVQRLLSEAVPQILSGKPQAIADMNAKVEQIRQKTGLDLRQFEQVAIGVSMKQIAANEVDLEPVFLARGKYNAGALVALAKLASNGKYREEKIGDRTIYVFTMQQVAEQGVAAANKSQTKNSWLDGAIQRMIKGLSKEVAVASYDGSTLAFGSLARVRETFEGKQRVSGEILSLANRRPNAVMSFGAKLPNGLSNFIKLDNDELGATLDSIRQASGSLELIGGNTAVSFAAKTVNAEQAQNLHETLEGLQMLGKTFLGGSKSADKQVYVRMIENAKITRNQTEVALDLQVPQNDINILLGAK